MSLLFIGLKYVSLKDVGLKDVGLKDVMVPLKPAVAPFCATFGKLWLPFYCKIWSHRPASTQVHQSFRSKAFLKVKEAVTYGPG